MGQDEDNQQLRQDLLEAADLCTTLAEREVQLKLKLGKKPTTEPAATEWETKVAAISSTVKTLSALNAKLIALEMSVGTAQFHDELGRIAAVSQAAKDEIDKFEKINDALLPIAAVISFLGKILIFTSAPSSTSFQGVLSAAQILQEAMPKQEHEPKKD